MTRGAAGGPSLGTRRCWPSLATLGRPERWAPTCCDTGPGERSRPRSPTFPPEAGATVGPHLGKLSRTLSARPAFRRSERFAKAADSPAGSPCTRAGREAYSCHSQRTRCIRASSQVCSRFSDWKDFCK